MMQKCMVLKPQGNVELLAKLFENDVEMYGAQTFVNLPSCSFRFENDVEMYGAQTNIFITPNIVMFENDVEMYGAQTMV